MGETMRFLSQPLTIDDVVCIITAGFGDAERDRLMDRLVGRVPGWRISEKRASLRPNEERDRKWTQLNDNGLSYTDIALAVGLPRGTVASAISRYRQFVRTQAMRTAEQGYDS
jgi:hypothetical protein